MRVVRSQRFDRAFGKLPPMVQHQVTKQLLLLEDNPYRPSLRTHKRRGEGEIWQARITRNYRLFFMMDQATITLLDIRPYD